MEPIQGPQLPPVQIPAEISGDVTAEPAKKIGDFFANQPLVKTMVVAAATLIAGVTGQMVDNDTIEAIVTLISGIGIFATFLIAQFEASNRAKEQAAVTRDAVYSPATVARVTGAAYEVERKP